MSHRSTGDADMTRMMRMTGLAVAMASVAILDACHKKPEPAPAPVQQSTRGPDADSARRAQEDAARRAADAEAARRRADSIAAADAAARNSTGAAAALRTTLTATVHF